MYLIFKYYRFTDVQFEPGIDEVNMKGNLNEEKSKYEYIWGILRLW